MNYTLDIECFPNYFLVVVYDTKYNSYQEAQLSNDRGQNSLHKLSKELARLKKSDIVFTYNGINYDLPLLEYALEAPRTNEEIFLKSQALIDTDSYEHRRFSYLNFTHIDLMELLNLNKGSRTEDEDSFVSLKKAAAILGFETILDLPKDYNLPLEPGEAKEIVAYCKNDCRATAFIAEFAESEILSRQLLGAELYPDLDFTTLGRPRVGKKALVETYRQLTGKSIYKLKEEYWGDEMFTIYKKMASINMKFADLMLMDYSFTSDGGKDLYEKVLNFSRFMWYGTAKETRANGFECSFEIAGKRYLMAEGGLHDEIGGGVWNTGEGKKLFNLDAKSFYPFIIKEYNVSPVYAPDFGKCIAVPTDFRIRAKDMAKGFDRGSDQWKYFDDLANSTKIVINAGFGQFGDIWSPFYDPRCVLKTTINGQLMLIMLIDWLTEYIGGIEVVQANTDGIAVLCPLHLETRLRSAVSHWEKKTRMILEIEELDRLVKKNANSYMEIKGGKVIKGAKEFNTLVEPGRSRANEIIKRCMIAYYKDGTYPKEVVMESDDIHDFLTVVSAKGAVNYFRIDGSEYAKMQRTLRYYKAVNGGSLGRMFKKGKNINSWPNAVSVRVPLEIKDPRLKNFPDLDREWYIKQAWEKIKEVLAESKEEELEEE